MSVGLAMTSKTYSELKRELRQLGKEQTRLAREVRNLEEESLGHDHDKQLVCERRVQHRLDQKLSRLCQVERDIKRLNAGLLEAWT